MKKTLKLMLAGAFALLAFSSCSDDEEEIINPGNEYDDSYFASQATVSSSDTNYIANGNDGTIQFKAEGGSVTLNVSCGCEWLVENTASDLFATTMTSTSVTVTAVQNTVEEDLTATIIFKTVNQRITFSTITVNQTAYGAPEITAGITEWNFPALGALTIDIAVEASEEWTAESTAEWLTIVKTSDGIDLTAVENEETKPRNTKITLACTDGIRTAHDYIDVSQDGKAYITLSVGSISFGSDENSADVTVESNFDWDYIYDSSNSWLTFSRDGNVLTITASANESGDEREETVTFAAGDGAANATEEQLTIRQVISNEDDMVLTYTITSANTSTQLPLYGEVDCTVDWGDGSVIEVITSTVPSHTYAAAGEYDITINGTVTALYSKDISKSASPLPITAVKQWGKTGLTDMQYAFYYCKDLISIPEDNGEALSGVTSFYYTFYYCNSLTSIPAGLFDSCSSCTTFAYVFYYCTSLTELPPKLFDNCTEVTTFRSAFQNCTSLQTIPENLFNKCTENTSFQSVFQKCTALTGLPSGLFDNCSKVTTFQNSFNACESITVIPSGLFDDCINVTSFYYTFYGCSSLETIPAGLFDNCTEVTTFSFVFYGCSSLKSIPSEGIFGNCPKVTKYEYAFEACSSLTEIPAGLFDSSPEVTSFYSVFYDCAALTTIPKGLFSKNTKVEDFYAAFYRCYALEEIPAGLFDNCPNVTNFSMTFYACQSVSKIPAGLFDNCTKVTTFRSTFYDWYALEEIPAGLFDSCTEVEDFQYVFRYSTSLVSVPTGLFSKNLKATKFSYAFLNCSAVVGESPYTEIEVDGETVRVHLYDRANYTAELGCVAPTSYTRCFGDSSFSDIGSIPSGWK